MSYNLLNEEYMYLSKIKNDKYDINYYLLTQEKTGKVMKKINLLNVNIIKLLLKQYIIYNNNNITIYCHKTILEKLIKYILNNNIKTIDKNKIFKSSYEYIYNIIMKKYKYNSNNRYIKKIILSLNDITNYETKYYILLSLYEKFIIKTYIDKSKIPIRNKLCKKIDNNDNIIKDTINVFTSKHINFIYE